MKLIWMQIATQKYKKTFIEKQLSYLNVEKIARETGFYKAAPRKTSITHLIVSFSSDGFNRRERIPFMGITS